MVRRSNGFVLKFQGHYVPGLESVKFQHLALDLDRKILAKV